LWWCCAYVVYLEKKLEVTMLSFLKKIAHRKERILRISFGLCGYLSEDHL
jgi:hypothetical protein